MTRERLLSVQLNNALSLGLGLVTVVYVTGILVMASAPLSENASFIGLVIVGSFL